MFDVVIIGGGLTGATAALALKNTNPAIKIAVVEAFAANDTQQPSFDDRSIALAAQSVAYLRQHQLFDENVPYAAAIKHVTVSDRGHFGKTHIDHSEYNVDALGYVVEVRPWGQSLHQKMQALGISLFCPATVSEFTQQQTHVELTLNSAEQISARLMVVADGANSNTLNKLHIQTHTSQYQQAAIIANIEVAQGHQNQAFERFTNTGPMALLPMSQSRYSLVWCVAPDEVDALLALDETDFLARLQAAFGYRAGQFTKVGMRANYPLVVGKPERLIHHRVAVLGNAAHIVHPIAGQGFNLGLRDVICLEKLISKAFNAQQDIASFSVLNQYQVERNQDIDHVLWLTDALVRGFSNNLRSAALVRNTVLAAMNKCQRLKAPLAKQLMGNVG